MIKILSIALIIILITAGLIYFRFFAVKTKVTPVAQSQSTTQGPVEVPKTLPGATIEERVKILENALSEVIKKVNLLERGGSQSSDNSLNTRLNSIEASVTDLKTQISGLQAPPPAASSSKSVEYIPIGAGGTYDHSSYTTLNDYQINLDPANFPGYTGMVLEVIFRVVDSVTNTSVRLYNTTDGSAISPELSSSSSSFSLLSTASFKLTATSSKTYALQAKNSGGRTFYIQLARLKVIY